MYFYLINKTVRILSDQKVMSLDLQCFKRDKSGLNRTGVKYHKGIFLNPLLASGDFCCLLISVAKSYDPEQA